MSPIDRQLPGASVPHKRRPNVTERRGDSIALLLPCGRVSLFDEADEVIVATRRWYSRTSVVGRAYVSAVHPHIYLHRLLTQAPQGLLVDHINGDSLDNRRVNLRLATPLQSSGNTRKRSDRTGFKGVVHYPDALVRPWVAIFRTKYIGGFATEIEAALAYDQAAKQAYGEFACLNFPDRWMSAPHGPSMPSEFKHDAPILPARCAYD